MAKLTLNIENKIEKEGEEAILQALATNTTITSIILQGVLI